MFTPDVCVKHFIDFVSCRSCAEPHLPKAQFHDSILALIFGIPYRLCSVQLFPNITSVAAGFNAISLLFDLPTISLQTPQAHEFLHPQLFHLFQDLKDLHLSTPSRQSWMHQTNTGIWRGDDTHDGSRLLRTPAQNLWIEVLAT